MRVALERGHNRPTHTPQQNPRHSFFLSCLTLYENTGTIYGHHVMDVQPFNKVEKCPDGYE